MFCSCHYFNSPLRVRTMKWLAIINPRADHHTREDFAILTQDFGRYLQADFAWTSFPKHASQIAQNSKGYEGIIAVGGDGTIAEIINGLNGSKPVLGVF